MGMFAALGGATAGVGEGMYQDRLRQEKMQQDQVEEFRKRLYDMMASPNVHPSAKMALDTYLNRINSAKNLREAFKTVSDIQKEIQVHKQITDAEVQKQQTSQGNLPQPLAPPPGGGMMPQGAKPAVQQPIQPETTGQGIYKEFTPSGMGQMAGQAEVEKLKPFLDMLQQRGLQPPPSIAGQDKFRVNPGQPLRGEDIGRKPGTWWNSISNVATNEVIDYIQTGAPGYTQPTSRAPSDIEEAFFRQHKRYPTIEELAKYHRSIRPEQTVVIETVDAKGNPVRRIVPKRAGAEYQAPLTSTTKTMRETAPKIKGFVGRIRPLVDAQRQQLGPAAGRWGEFMTGAVGASNPGFARLRTDIGLLQTLLMRMHVGARGGVQLMDHFKNLIDSGKQSPENLLAALDEIEAYAEELGAMEAGLTPPPDAQKQPSKKLPPGWKQ